MGQYCSSVFVIMNSHVKCCEAPSERLQGAIEQPLVDISVPLRLRSIPVAMHKRRLPYVEHLAQLCD